MEIKIDKGVPVPVHGGPTTKYAPAVRSLEVGDSFWISKNDVGNGFPGAVRNLSIAIGIKTVIRTVEQNGVKGWRVWRIASPEKNSAEEPTEARKALETEANNHGMA